MNRTASTQGPATARDVIIAALWVGLVVGVIEGIGWMVIQRFDRLTNLWTQVLWIAPVLDGILFLALGVAAAALLRIAGPARGLPIAAYLVALGAAGNLIALVFQSFLHPAALGLFALGFAAVLTRWFRRDEQASIRFFRRSLPAVAALVVGLFVAVQGYYAWHERSRTAALEGAPAGAPNVVVVVIDALRADRVSAYGNPRETSPFIDRLAAEGALFEVAVAASPYTLPSHASLLAGLYPYEHGVEWLDFKQFGHRDYPSIAEELLDRGYRTGAFSANPFWFTREQGYGRGFLRFEDFYHTPADMAYRTVFGKIFEKMVMPRIGWEDVPARKDATMSTDRVLRWVAREDEHRFFAFVNYFDVHDPYLPPEPYRSRFSDGAGDPPGGLLNWRLGRGELDLTPEERERELEAYDGALAYVDHEIERLVDGIRELRPDEGLLVIVTSDHGEAFGEHGWYLHGKSLYREETRIPLVVWWPEGVPAGTRIARPVSHASIPATILDLVAGPEAATFGSPSLARLWRDSAAAADWPWPLSEQGQRDWVDPRFPVQHGDMRSLTSPDWHFIHHDSLPEELYAADDDLEATNRIGDPGTAAAVEAFQANLRRRPR